MVLKFRFYNYLLIFFLNIISCIIIPICFFEVNDYFWLYIFPAYFVANLIVEGNLSGCNKSCGRLLFTSLIASILISGIDMAVDPLDATKMSEWVWTKNNYTGYYGIPYLNYLGYVLVMTPAMFIFGWIQERGLRAR